MKYYLLVDEKPESCETCPLRSYSDLMLVCTPMREAASDVECPLRPLPNKKEEWVDSGYIPMDGFPEKIFDEYSEGWNDCIDEITGETE